MLTRLSRLLRHVFKRRTFLVQHYFTSGIVAYVEVKEKDLTHMVGIMESDASGYTIICRLL